MSAAAPEGAATPDTIDAHEAAALLGFASRESLDSHRRRNADTFPEAIPTPGRMRWHLADILAYQRKRQGRTATTPRLLQRSLTEAGVPAGPLMQRAVDLVNVGRQLNQAASIADLIDEIRRDIPRLFEEAEQ